jgi:hypothetical protein
MSGPQGVAEAQEPADRAARSRLQLALHAQRTVGLLYVARLRDPLRDEIREVGDSRSQTHRRAAMCGFTQDDGYVRGMAPTHERSSGSFLDFLLATLASPALVVVCLAVVTLPPRSTGSTVAGCRLVGCSVVSRLPLRSHAVAGVSHRVCVSLGPVLASHAPSPPTAAAAA